jgi:hypothetical protein
MNRQRGAVLIDMIMGLLLSFLVGAVIMSAMQTSIASRDTVIEQNESQTSARQPLDLMADHVRNAQLASAAPYRVLDAGTATSLTYYTDSSRSSVSYFLDGTTLKRTEGDLTVSPTTVLTGVTSLRFVYYKIATYNASGFIPCTSPSAPTSAELNFLAAIQIDATVTQDGYTSSYSTLVRLRNSPRKTTL